MISKFTCINLTLSVSTTNIKDLFKNKNLLNISHKQIKQ